MAFPKKKSRRITVNNEVFRWVVNSNYTTVIIFIISETHNANKLFGYFRHKINGKEACYFRHPFIIEPHLVRKTILYGISKGYTLNEKCCDLNLGDLSEALVINTNT